MCFSVVAGEGPADGQDPATRGDEDDIASEEIKGDEHEKCIPDDFYYENHEHISRPKISDGSGLPKELLSLEYPFYI